MEVDVDVEAFFVLRARAGFDVGEVDLVLPEVSMRGQGGQMGTWETVG